MLVKDTQEGLTIEGLIIVGLTIVDKWWMLHKGQEE